MRDGSQLTPIHNPIPYGLQFYAEWRVYSGWSVALATQGIVLMTG